MSGDSKFRGEVKCREGMHHFLTRSVSCVYVVFIGPCVPSARQVPENRDGPAVGDAPGSLRQR